ncbi:MAG: hypothetical protein EA409_00790 [Saprospirales bacterium]|nr:MAG: hypothetical protein EA409_00790 [Saprospirales bacterium]
MEKQENNNQASGDFLSPFTIEVEPMERLLLINFEKDPDSTYLGFEPQVFDDEVHGKGHLIIGWRLDGKVDVYHQPSLILSPENYDIAGKGLNEMRESQFEAASFEVGEKGVMANYIFHDLHGRKVELYISEDHPKKRKPFGLLAPMGSAAEKPSAMPLVILHDFYFVRRSGTELRIHIDGRRHKPDTLPFPIDLTMMYFARYSPQPLIARLNPECNGPLSPLNLAQSSGSMQEGDYVFDFREESGKVYLNKLTRLNDIHPLEIVFIDPFPNLISMEKPSQKSGLFQIQGHPSTGLIKGQYSIERDLKTIKTTLSFYGWEPNPDKLSLRFLYTVVKMFKKWPSAYEWTSHIHQAEDDVFFIKSKWLKK